MTIRLRALRLAGRVVAATPARRLLAGDLARRIRLGAGREVTPATALAVVDAIESAGLAHWVMGGWGVDALLGRQTRPHLDLDVVVDRSVPDLRAQVDTALTGAGFSFSTEETSIQPLPVVWVYSDGRGAKVEILPADLTAPPFAAPGAWAPGRIDGQPVPCISADLQRQLRTGYELRDSDREDLAALDGLDR